MLAEHGFHVFKQLGARSRAQLVIAMDPEELADFYVSLWRAPGKLGHFARSAAAWLNNHDLDGIALLDQLVTSSAVAKKYFPIVKVLFSCSK